MIQQVDETKFGELSARLAGDLYYNNSPAHQAQLLIYSTDASVYQEKPVAVAIPHHVDDIKTLVDFANKNKLTLVPRAAGTSLAGQVVSSGIIVDISRYFNKIIEVNKEEKWVRVHPGIIRDDLNKLLFEHGLMFGPETSTSNRALIGGMIGNNSCGLHSIVWGDTRKNLLGVKAILSDGSDAEFKQEEFHPATETGFRKEIYNGLHDLLGNESNRKLIEERFPKRSITRRNTGYALDSLIEMQPFNPTGEPFNLCKLIAGSEGTLMIVTEVKLQLIDLPPRETALVCVHCNSIDESLRANIIALTHKPMASELVDRHIINFTKLHPEFKKNCFFIKDDPAAILMVEFMADTKEAVAEQAVRLMDELKSKGYGYAYPILYNHETKFAWDVRKAGLGLLRNEPGDTQPVNLIEDCAVSPDELPDYVNDLQKILAKHGTTASYYAHAGAGELHIEPLINLKTEEGLRLFRTILEETVGLVKKYNGSLSGEHGDGRLRGEYIPAIMGSEVYEFFRKVKQLFDPNDIFNKGKIVDTPPMDTALRVQQGQQPNGVKTNFDFSYQEGILRLSEKCSGSGDCRRSEMNGGLMCPSFMATRNEKDSTRARANILRQYLSNAEDPEPLTKVEIKEVMDLCLSCKGCKTECPSGVDITKMKAEFLQHYYDKNGVPFRAKMIGNFSSQMKMARAVRPFYNFIFNNKALRAAANNAVGFHPDRSIPLLPAQTLHDWYNKRKKSSKTADKKVYFFCDEFTNYYDVEIGKTAFYLLEALGYEVIIPDHVESGRTYLSKGLVRKAASIANENIGLLKDLVSADTSIIGIEPSAILTLRDEYLDLATPSNKEKANQLAANAFTIEEFLVNEESLGRFSRDLFTDEKRTVAVHGHCYQKVLSSQHYSSNMLSLPRNYLVHVIPSGCCGMAGSFGYEKEHYEVSQQVGELVLFPTVRKLDDDTMIAAAGTSCRHQIKDGTGKKAEHPVEILYKALLRR